MGLGLHGGGLATTQWLLRHDAKVLVTDLRSAKALKPSLRQLPRTPRLRFVLGRHRHSDFRTADLVVANPDVPSHSPYLATARREGVPVVNEATIFFALCPAKIIGVTGTKGKSTVSALLFHLLKTARRKAVLAGNIRSTAMLAVLDKLSSATTVVLELSSWQLEGLPSIRRSPEIGIITNLLDDHLNRYASKSSYFASKDSIWRYQTPADCILLNRDNRPTRVRGEKVHARRYWFSLRPFTEENGIFCRGASFVFRSEGRETRIASTADLRLPGPHNVSNALAALCAARLMGVSSHTLRIGLRSFRGISGRLELVKNVRGVAYYNDTTATAPDAAIAALKSFDRRPIVIAGGVDKKLPYGSMARAFQQGAKRVVFLPGSATKKLLRRWKKSIPYLEAQSMEEAVQKAAALASPGDVVVLSPGAASFNLFLHEFDRGERFVRAVRSL